MERNAPGVKKFRKYLFWKTGLALIQIYRQELKGNGSLFLKFNQEVEEAEAILPAAYRDQNSVSGLDHGMIYEGAADLPIYLFKVIAHA